MDHARGEMGQPDVVRILRCLGETDDLGFLLGGFGESAELGEAQHQEGATGDPTAARLTFPSQIQSAAGLSVASSTARS